MKNKYLIIGIILVILLAGASWYFMTMKSSSEVKNGSPQSSRASQSAAKMTNLQNLLQMGKDQKCTFSYESPEKTTMQGTTYLSSTGKMRTEFYGTDTEGKSYDGNMINDTEYMYTWNSQLAQGVKLPITADMEKTIDEAQNNPQVNQQYLDQAAQMEYECTSWMSEPSQFIPPSEIQFMDLTEQMKVMEDIKGNPDTKQAQCMACSYAQGEEQTKCKEALGCE